MRVPPEDHRWARGEYLHLLLIRCDYLAFRRRFHSIELHFDMLVLKSTLGTQYLAFCRRTALGLVRCRCLPFSVESRADLDWSPARGFGMDGWFRPWPELFNGIHLNQ